MKAAFAGPWLVTLVVAACGGGARVAETGPRGGAGAAGADACATGKQTYQQQRSELLQAGTRGGCKQNADCGSLYESNACVAGCGLPFPGNAVDATASQLRELASAVCSSCPPIPIPPCVPPAPLECVAGQCVEEG